MTRPRYVKLLFSQFVFFYFLLSYDPESSLSSIAAASDFQILPPYLPRALAPRQMSILSLTQSSSFMSFGLGLLIESDRQEVVEHVVAPMTRLRAAGRLGHDPVAPPP